MTSTFISSVKIVYNQCLVFLTVLLQNGADHSIRNTDGKTALDLADAYARSVLTGKALLVAKWTLCSIQYDSLAVYHAMNQYIFVSHI